jgi:pSer/pThr/pTyr-binding forkhead associated (FHA) protein
MSAAKAQLMLRGDASKVAKLDPTQPFTIGKASSNQLSLASAAGVSEHHAVVRYSPNQGWLVCDWQSSDGTFLEGQRIRRCRPLSDRDEIQLGQTGPVLVFLLQSPPPRPSSAPPTPAAQRPPAGAAASASPPRINVVLPFVNNQFQKLKPLVNP